MSLTFQDNLGINEGEVIEGSTYNNVLFFQPALPIPVGKDMVFSRKVSRVTTLTNCPHPDR